MIRRQRLAHFTRRTSHRRRQSDDAWHGHDEFEARARRRLRRHERFITSSDEDWMDPDD
jgi:hypothetical protein